MTIIQPGIRREQEVGYGRTDQRLYAFLEIDGIKQDPASITANVYLPGQVDDPEVEDGVVTEDATTNQFYYALNASSTSTWGLGLRGVIRFAAVLSGRTHHIQRSFVIVRNPISHYPPCRADDLLNAHVSIEDALVQAGIISAPSTADPSRFIVESWEEVLNWLESNGKTPGYVMNPDCLAPLVRARARALMFRALRIIDADLYGKLSEDWQEDFETLLQHPPHLIYDPADSLSPGLEPAPLPPLIGISGREHHRRRLRMGAA